MEPGTIDHPEATVWKGYESDKIGKISDLHAVRTDNGVIWSKWVPSWTDLFRLVFGGSVYVGVYAIKQPPISVAAHRGEFFKYGDTDDSN